MGSVVEVRAKRAQVVRLGGAIAESLRERGSNLIGQVMGLSRRSGLIYLEMSVVLPSVGPAEADLVEAVLAEGTESWHSKDLPN